MVPNITGQTRRYDQEFPLPSRSFRIEMNLTFEHNKTVFKNIRFEPAKQDKETLLLWLDGEMCKPLTDANSKETETDLVRLLKRTSSRMS
jgi:hypothetical protein